MGSNMCLELGLGKNVRSPRMKAGEGSGPPPQVKRGGVTRFEKKKEKNVNRLGLISRLLHPLIPGHNLSHLQTWRFSLSHSVTLNKAGG